MNLTKAIAIFDIGKTNKKVLLFNEKLEVIYQHEEKFKTTTDDDGFECDDINLIEKWIKKTLMELVKSPNYHLAGVNFATYGASLGLIDKNGKRITPIYNYLKDIPESIQNNLFEQYGEKDEFCRKTASPALGLLLNSGLQLLWLKKEKPQIFQQIAWAMHFPQYLSYTLTGNVTSESTSIGCHTFMWDFDKNQYHQWLTDNNIELPKPLSNKEKTEVEINGRKVSVGIGIHDSSASLAPYIRGSNEKFMLISTGTWCINMNPFNHTPLTANELDQDCLCYISIGQKPVKSSRLFMGHIHDVNTEQLTKFFKVPADSFKKVKTNECVIQDIIAKKEPVFFKNGMPENYVDKKVDLNQFDGFDHAYHQLMYDITLLNKQSIDLVIDKDSFVRNLYVSGGFARNEIFVRLLANFYPGMEVFTSQVDNATALGAALVIWDVMEQGETPEIDLGLKKWEAFNILTNAVYGNKGE